jgi:hypothetical protein
VKTQAKSPLTRFSLNLKLIVEDKEAIEHERKEEKMKFLLFTNLSHYMV